MSDRIYVEFDDDNLREQFINLYNGDFMSYHPNYKGRVGEDVVLGSFRRVYYLERSKVIDFMRLGQDVRMFGGRIVNM